jgi:hypothetical protein
VVTVVTVAVVVTVVVVAEVGDFNRFDNPRQLMACLGLTPSEHSSGASVRRGGITKAASSLARRALVEGAPIRSGSYRMQAPQCFRPPNVSGPCQPQASRPDPRSAAGGPRHCVERAAAYVPTLQASDGGRQTEGGGYHGDRPRDGRLHPGYCANRDTSQHLLWQRHWEQRRIDPSGAQGWAVRGGEPSGLS